MVWQRPTSVPHPQVWCHYVGKRALPNGQFPKFRIQDAPPDMFKEIVDHMCTHFLKGEPISVVTDMLNDPVSVAESRQFWIEALEQKMVLVALEEKEDGSVTLAGVNITKISVIEDQKKKWKFAGVANQKLFGILTLLMRTADVFARYGVTEYMTAMGLSVAPEYRGQGLGLELLLARIPLCKATGLKLTSTVFTAGNSQELARRAGFEVLGEVKYKEYKVDGEEVFAGITAEYCKVMALKIN